jgi:putative ABC transport system permease protein
VARGSSDSRGLLRLLFLSAVTALFLAIIGVFGVTAFGVSQRVREFGVHLALGASPTTIAALVLGSG